MAGGPAELSNDTSNEENTVRPQGSATDGSVSGAPGGRWGPVYGELLTFDDPETRLPAIDRLEGFLPDGPCLYWRVLVPVDISSGLDVCWQA